MGTLSPRYVNFLQVVETIRKFTYLGDRVKVGNVKGMLESQLYTIRKFTYLGDRVSPGGECEGNVSQLYSKVVKLKQ